MAMHLAMVPAVTVSMIDIPFEESASLVLYMESQSMRTVGGSALSLFQRGLLNSRDFPRLRMENFCIVPRKRGGGGE
jgi:hypothetical protein